MKEHILSRRDFLRMSGVMGVALGLAACSPQAAQVVEEQPTTAPAEQAEEPVGEAPASEPIEVIFWHNTGEAPIQERLDNLAARFADENPGLTATCEYMGTGREVMEKVITSIAGDEPPHLSFGYPHWAVKFLEDGATVSLSPYIDGDAEFDKNDHQDATWIPATWKGQIAAMPQTYHPYILYYNTEAFEEVGATIPKDWEELYDTAKLLTRDTDGDGQLDRWGLDLAWDDAWHWLVFHRNNGGEFINEARTEFLWNTPEGIEAMEFVDSLFNEIKAVPEGSVEQGFQMGLIGMTMAGPWRIEGYLAGNAPVDVALIPWKKRPLAEANVDMVIMYETSQAEQDAAWEFLKLFVGPDFQMSVAQQGYYYPLLKSVAADAGYKSWLEETPIMKHLLELEGQWTTMEATQAGEEPIDILQREMELALRGEKGIQAALDTAVAESNVLIQ
ncbi:MAG: extracellular solute-binding protein [Anaerolineales bacterium]|nr:extracellular solute-binding protein [Anaerolineales bacterium]